MKTIAFLMLFLSVLSLKAGDGLDTKIAVKSDEELDTEVKRLAESLPPSISANFQKAVATIGTDWAVANALKADEGGKKLYEEITGLSVGQVIDKGKAIDAKSEENKENMRKMFPKNYPKSPENPEGYDSK